MISQNQLDECNMILQNPNSPNLHFLSTIILAYIANEEQVHILSNLDAVIDRLVQVSFGSKQK